MELSSSNIFSKESFFNISGNKNTEMISYISGHRNPKKLFIFQDVTFRAQKKKKKKKHLQRCLIFQEMQLSSLKISNFIRRLKTFQDKTSQKSQAQKILCF